MSQKKYISTGEALQILGISRETLRKYLKEFKHGVHYQDRRRKGARKSSLFFNIEAIYDYWQTRPEKR
ncbi:hypothetical protein [Pseudanabaena sp. ABRG5-3]|uniref:hypothetical protein n=1 Tax=Pseudanabaena sp. ABRG5-3 TaxID=685565 RepID=UPI000DC6F319|nr:hypothetical protein [Pseudanabaena sp. ABRG5-3]BBC24786.1 hypothetical protein ABRG53_2529 [Pseudanabaena sp. ABRG5-3]